MKDPSADCWSQQWHEIKLCCLGGNCSASVVVIFRIRRLWVPPKVSHFIQQQLGILSNSSSLSFASAKCFRYKSVISLWLQAKPFHWKQIFFFFFLRLSLYYAHKQVPNYLGTTFCYLTLPCEFSFMQSQADLTGDIAYSELEGEQKLRRWIS